MLNSMGFVAGADCFCALMLIVILYASFFEVKGSVRFGKIYEIMTILVFLACVFDLSTYLFPGLMISCPPLYMFLAYMTYALGFLIASAYAYYIEAYLQFRGKKDNWIFPNTIICIAITLCVITAVMFVMGGVYIIEDGALVRSWGRSYLQLSMVVGMIVITAYVFSNRHLMPTHDIIALSSYIVLPLIGILFTVLTKGRAVTFPLCAVSMVLLFVMLNLERQRNMKERNMTLSDESKRDSLTGALNRRAFDEYCEQIDKDNNVGVIFLDANGLKYSNDHYGHKAGDELLQRLVSILRDNFRGDIIYRISGDEFVVMIEGISLRSFESRSLLLHEMFKNMEFPIAAMGYSYGNGSQIKVLLDQAESKMYTDKKKFHKEYPQFTRENKV